MAQAPVIDYKISWKLPTNEARIHVKFPGTNWNQVPVSGIQEFHALVAILQGPKAVFYDTVNKVFSTD